MVKAGYFLEDEIHALDTTLFNPSANEVASMDPPQTLLLESVYHALENGTRYADPQYTIDQDKRVGTYHCQDVGNPINYS